MKKLSKANNKKKIKILHLRGYIEQIEKHKYFGICLTLNLHVYGNTPEDAFCRLKKLIKMYLVKAAKTKRIHDFFPRRAPLSLYSKYFKFVFLFYLHSSSIFELFKTQEKLAYAH